MGKTPSRNNAEYWNSNEYKWISIADLSKTGKYIRDTKEHLSKQAIDESGIKLIPANTVIMSFKLSIGKTAITAEDIINCSSSYECRSFLQDRDPLTVPSTRRNPVLADVFNRLAYMERKGSGFGKIIGGYEFQINYNETKRPSFRSDRYQFTVVMPNLNYNRIQNVPQDVPQNVPQNNLKNPLDIQILNMINKNNKISTEKMAMTLGISSKTVKRHIKEMDMVQFIGRGSNGHWEIQKKEKQK